MALRDQPYLPLYIQDFLTDEKLNECTAHATGVYIRLMCLMHKSEQYGTILLKQKDKQNNNQIKNFALKIAKSMPYSPDDIYSALAELLDEKVIQIEGDLLLQKRMVRDNEISIKRSETGSKGGKKTQEKYHKSLSEFAKAKNKANTENENEYENEIENITDNIDKYRLVDFEKFWAKMPNKVSKKKCWDKWKKLNGEQIDKILETVDRWIAYKPFESYTHPHPLTYLNQERWNDELPSKIAKLTTDDHYAHSRNILKTAQ